MESNIFKKRNSIFVKTGIYSFIGFCFVMYLFTILFLWITENNLKNLVISQNNEQIFIIVSQFDKNIESYRLEIEQDSNSSIFINTVMNPTDTEYYIDDFMNEIKISNITGELVLLSFDGTIINSTKNNEYEKGEVFYMFENIEKASKEYRSTQILDNNHNVIIFSSIIYNNLTEGYLLFITEFENIFLSNRHLFTSKEHLHTFLAVTDDNIIAQIGDTNEKNLSSIYPLKELPVTLQIQTSRVVIENHINNILFRMVVISIISALLLAILLSLITSKQVTKPLSLLEHDITMVGKGVTNSLPHKKNDPIEINFIRTSFNNMQESITKNKNQLEMSNKQLLKINNELKSAQKQLVQSEKMASIGQLAAGVAHEINNPTGFVTTNLYTMSQYMEVYKSIFDINHELYEKVNAQHSGDELIELINKINKIKEEEDFDFILDDSLMLLKESIDGVHRITDIVTGLRNFARPESKITTLGDINTAIKDALKLTWNELKYKCTVEENLSNLPQILCRLDQITQVFVNLFVNAAHAIVDHGVIKINTYVEGDFIYAIVEDNGEGIPPENIEKLFDPFFTTKEVGKGTGLGLSISYGIIQEHGGNIDIDSTLGVGTSFTLSFKI